MAARTTASILRAAGLGDLVTTSIADYKSLAISLAKDRPLRGALRAQLLANRDTSPLFDAAAFATALEAAYTQMANTARAQ